jgi:hypothetical protein
MAGVKRGAPASTDPKNVRARIRRRAGKVNEINELVDLLPNYDVSTWDYEELARGRPRDKNGGFGGKRPKWVTHLVIQEAQRRLKDWTLEEIALQALDAVKAIGNIITNDEVDDDGKPIVSSSVRLQAAQFIVEHMVGKAKVHVDVDTGDKLTAMLARAIVNPDGSGYMPKMIEGELADPVDDAEDEDDDSE